jgi:hypothetical protein
MSDIHPSRTLPTSGWRKPSIRPADGPRLKALVDRSSPEQARHQGFKARPRRWRMTSGAFAERARLSHPLPEGRGRDPRRRRGRERGDVLSGFTPTPCRHAGWFSSPSPSHRCAAGPALSLWERVFVGIERRLSPSAPRRTPTTSNAYKIISAPGPRASNLPHNQTRPHRGGGLLVPARAGDGDRTERGRAGLAGVMCRAAGLRRIQGPGRTPARQPGTTGPGVKPACSRISRGSLTAQPGDF